MPSPDWPALAELAMRRFGWSAEQFWAATPVEFVQMLRGSSGASGTALSRSELDMLIARLDRDPSSLA